MALPYRHAGTLTRSAGIYSALAKQAKLLNLKPAKRIQITFDPFGENVVETRRALTFFHQETVRSTNHKCIVKTTIVNTRAEPTIDVTLDTGHKIAFKTKNLQCLEILKLFNQLVSSKVVIEEKPQSIPQTKGQRKK